MAEGCEQFLHTLPRIHPGLDYCPALPCDAFSWLQGFDPTFVHGDLFCSMLTSRQLLGLSWGSSATSSSWQQPDTFGFPIALMLANPPGDRDSHLSTLAERCIPYERSPALPRRWFPPERQHDALAEHPVCPKPPSTQGPMAKQFRLPVRSR